MRRLILLLVAALLLLPTAAAQVDDLPNVYAFDSGAFFRYPADWEAVVEDGFVYVDSEETSLLVFDHATLIEYDVYGDDLLDVLDETFYAIYGMDVLFNPTGVQMTSIGGREAAVYDYIDDYGDAAVIVAVTMSDGSFGVIDAACFYECATLAERDTVMQIAATFDVGQAPPPVADPPAYGADAAHSFRPDACPFDFPLPAGLIEGDNLTCGWLVVYVDHDDPAAGIIELAVAILHSQSANPLPDPIVYLEGGPGGSALVGVDAWVDTPLRNNRDIILIDQRGTGYSRPTLDCPEFYEDIDDPERACFDRLTAEGYDLSVYTSAQSAADIADLRVALGLEQVNLFGISYGTRLALTVMRDYPEGVRSVILDSTYPPQVEGYDEQAANGAAAMLHLFETCAADPACSAAYGDIEATFYALIDELNTSPYIYTDEYDEEVEVPGDDLVDVLFDSLYDTSVIPTLPYGIYLMSQGDYYNGLDVLSGYYTADDLQAIAAGEDPYADYDDSYYEEDYGEDFVDGDSEGAFNAVECAEELPFNSPDAAAALVAGFAPQLQAGLLDDIEEMFDVCAMWNLPAPDPVEDTPVVSDIPTLVLAGAFDPVTPAAWGQAAAQTLSSGYYFAFPHAGHGVVDAGDCAVSVITQFLANPAAVPDASCIAAERVTFFIGDTSIMENYSYDYGFDDGGDYGEYQDSCTIWGWGAANLRAGPTLMDAVAGQLADGGCFLAVGLYDDGEYLPDVAP